MTATTGHMIDICMLSCNRARITETAIRELKRRTTTPHRLTVVDNGSDRAVLDALDALALEGLIERLIFLPDNRGIHAGFNELLEWADSDLYVCTDNDLVPQAPTAEGDWLGQLIALMERHPDYAAMSCLPHFLVGDSLAAWLDGAGEIIERPWCGAALRLMRRAAVRETGGWRRDAGPGRNNEERWICTRLRERGWRVGYSRDIRAIHLWGRPDLGEDDWGYPQGVEHGHRAVWPPVSNYNWDRLGIDWETCR